MSKKYAFLAAALVASGRSLSTISILDHGRRELNTVAPIGDDWPFCDRSALAIADLGSSSEKRRREQVVEPMSLPHSPRL
jgi:hypothetical protein